MQYNLRCSFFCDVQHCLVVSYISGQGISPILTLEHSEFNVEF